MCVRISENLREDLYVGVSDNIVVSVRMEV